MEFETGVMGRNVHIAQSLSRERASVEERTMSKLTTRLGTTGTEIRVSNGIAGTTMRNDTISGEAVRDRVIAILRQTTTRGARSGLSVTIITEAADDVIEVDLETDLYHQPIKAIGGGVRSLDQITMIRTVVTNFPGGKDARLLLRRLHPSQTLHIRISNSLQEAVTLRFQDIAPNLHSLSPIR